MPTPRINPTPRRAVLLVHTLPGGASHVDWMIERAAAIPSAPSAEHTLCTYRVVVRVDAPPYVPFIAVPIAEHRRRYLTFEGRITGDGGTVRRLARGQVVNDSPAATIRWHEGTIVRYEFEITPDGHALVHPTRIPENVGG
ncbi:MAG: hypothetical protein AAGI53_09070 [Planctomycetota bacterium]